MPADSVSILSIGGLRGKYKRWTKHVVVSIAAPSDVGSNPTASTTEKKIEPVYSPDK